jgi:large subunit ribosomal protein L15
VEYTEINLNQLASFEAGAEITPEILAEAAIIRKAQKPVVLLGGGEVSVALKVRLQRVTKGARAKIEAAGGSVEII